MRKKFGQDFIQKELERIGEKLKESLKVYLIGGGEMSFRGMKEATKDIDIVVTSGEDFCLLQEVLKKTGYSEVEGKKEEYVELGAQKILENDTGCRFDIFNQQVVDKLIFSKNMQERSESLGLKGDIRFKITSPEDIFLFKCVAGRTTDIEDMNILVQAGLDFKTIEKEVEVQADLLGEELYVTHIAEALNLLRENYSTTTPLPELLEKKIANVYDQLDILSKINGKTEVEKLKENIEISEKRIDEALRKLKRKESIKIKEDKVKKTETPQV